VVDDKADNRRLLRDLLVPVGFEVEEAADGASCVERVLADPPAAVLLDLRMPGLSGLETTRRLRELEPGRRLVVIAVSASVFGHDRDECIAAGADDFLAKPFRLERLLEMLSHHLALEPVYAEDASADSADVVFPAPDVVAELLEHARRGDIKQVLERAGRIEAADARHRAFVRDVRALAEQFQVKRLCLFLEEGRPIS
jgi:CheY-like chemotaxis protein